MTGAEGGMPRQCKDYDVLCAVQHSTLSTATSSLKYPFIQGDGGTGCPQ